MSIDARRSVRPEYNERVCLTSADDGALKRRISSTCKGLPFGGPYLMRRDINNESRIYSQHLAWYVLCGSGSFDKSRSAMCSNRSVAL